MSDVVSDLVDVVHALEITNEQLARAIYQWQRGRVTAPHCVHIATLARTQADLAAQAADLFHIQAGMVSPHNSARAH